MASVRQYGVRQAETNQADKGVVMGRWWGIVTRTAYIATLLVLADPWLPGYSMVQPATPGEPIGICDATFVLDANTVPTGEVPEWRAAVETLNRVTSARFRVVLRPVSEPSKLARATDFRQIPVVYRDSRLPSFRNSDYILAATYGEPRPAAIKGVYTRMVVVNWATVAELPRGAESGGRRWVYLHELGHVAGLDHNESPMSLMFPTITADSNVSEQDKADLRAVTRPCRDVASPHLGARLAADDPDHSSTVRLRGLAEHQ